MKNFILFCCILLCIPVLTVDAQKNNKKVVISGTVLDADDVPVSNAIVMVDGNKTSVMTDAEGYYQVKVKPYARTLGVVSFTSGMIEEEIADRTEINFYFKRHQAVKQEEETKVDEEAVVNTGYNKVEKENLTTSIGKVKDTRPKKTYSTIYEMLQTIPGVRVSGSQVNVQGASNFAGPVDPLFIVDGVPVTSIGDITPNTVESIEVLKGTSAAIYGTRGYGGVILIKRKSLE